MDSYLCEIESWLKYLAAFDLEEIFVKGAGRQNRRIVRSTQGISEAWPIHLAVKVRAFFSLTLTIQILERAVQAWNHWNYSVMCMDCRKKKFTLCIFISQSKFDCTLEQSLRCLAASPSFLAHSLTWKWVIWDRTQKLWFLQRGISFSLPDVLRSLLVSLLCTSVSGFPHLKYSFIMVKTIKFQFTLSAIGVLL